MPLVQEPFGDIITFTRASTATYFDATGTLQSAAINTPRFDYNPSTLAARGFLIEEQRTNSIRNNTMQGAVAPSTFPTNWQSVIVAGLTATVVGTGTQNGITYLDVRVSGTPTVSTFYNLVPDILVAGASGQTWTGSFWASLVAGSLTNTTPNIEIRESDAAQGFLTNTISAVSVTSTLTRYSQTRTLNNASTAFVSARFVWQVTIGLPVDFTLRIGLPQLELGAFATSVIPTTTTALTRSADVASVNTLSPWYNQSAMTFYAEYAPIYTASATVPSNTPHVLQAYNTAASQNNYAIRGVENVLNQVAVARNPTAGSQFPLVNLGTYGQAGVSRKVGYAINSSELQLAVNGSLGTTASNNAAALMATHDRMDIGSGTGGAPPYQLNGWLRRITYYPRRLSNADLQAITA